MSSGEVLWHCRSSACRSEVVLPRPTQECQDNQVRRDRKSQLDNPAVSHGRFAIHEIDVNVVMIEEYLIERMNRLEHGFLGNKKQPSLIRVMTDIEPLPGRRNNVQQIRRQAFRRLDVYSNRSNVTAHPHRCNCNAGIVTERAGDPRRPDRRSGGNLGKTVSARPSRVRSWRATMRAAPLARRTLRTLEAKAGASSGNRACSSPGEINRCPMRMPGEASVSIALLSSESAAAIILSPNPIVACD